MRLSNLASSNRHAQSSLVTVNCVTGSTCAHDERSFTFIYPGTKCEQV